MNVLFLAAIACLLCASALGERKTYSGYQVIDVLPKTAEEVKVLRKLMVEEESFDFWSEPMAVNAPVTIMAPPKQFRRLQVQLRKQGIAFETKVEDLGKIVVPSMEALDSRRKARGNQAFDINDFNTIDDINLWMTSLVSQCRSGLVCEVYSLGNSYNGRPLNVFKISKPGSGRKGYWIDAGIHAREWIAPATTIKILDALVRGSNANAVRLTDAYDWYIMPVMNVDGYDYSHTTERLWRKNRRPNAGTNCFGTDLNRNFAFRWGTEGVSTNPCAETYCGPSAGSEPETQRVSEELVRLGESLLATVTVHSYGNMWMFPWGNTVNHAGRVCDRAADHDELMRVSDLTANAIQATYGTAWARGNSCEVIYTTTGGTDDYAKGVAGVKYAFCPELRGNSFIIAASQIELSFNEVWNGIVAMCDAING